MSTIKGLGTIIEEACRRKKAQKILLKKMLETGLRVDRDGRFYFDNIEVSDTALAESLGIDRRVVRQTANYILTEPNLECIFTRLKPVAFFKDVAHYLGFTVIVVTSFPEKPGIISEVTSIIAKHKLVIREVFAEDPELFEEPKLTLIIEGDVPPEVISELQSIKVVKSLTIIK